MSQNMTKETLQAFTPDQQRAIERFVAGELTFAELEGFSSAQAEEIASLGHQLYGQGALEDARTLFEGLAAINHHDPYPQQLLGAIADKQGRWEDAMAHYRRCLELSPGNQLARMRLGLLQLHHGEPEEGVSELSELCRQDPQSESELGRRARLILMAMADVAGRVDAIARA